MIIGFTKHNSMHQSSIFNWPEEDSFRFFQKKNRTILAVADGITRGPLGSPTLPNYKILTKETELTLKYPLSSPARKAADLFCSSFIKFSKNAKPSLQGLKQIMKKTNNQIKILNNRCNFHPDYLEKDY